MSEPYLPIPDPEPDPYWDPHPARCPECCEIIDAHPASRADGRWEGRCQFHGTVVATYRFRTISDSEMADREEE